MKKFFSFRRNSASNLTTTFARERLSRSMPGEAGALASVRFGGMSV